jgi:hypothetical protein
MGMSLDQGPNVDLQAILAGGADFMKRLQDWNTAKEEHERALADLNLGQSARGAMDEASRQLEAAKAQAADIEAQSIAKATAQQKSLGEFVAVSQAEANRAMSAAQSHEREAAAKHAAADERLAEAGKKLAEADAKLSKATAAQAAVAAAQAALANV